MPQSMLFYNPPPSAPAGISLLEDSVVAERKQTPACLFYRASTIASGYLWNEEAQRPSRQSPYTEVQLSVRSVRSGTQQPLTMHYARATLQRERVFWLGYRGWSITRGPSNLQRHNTNQSHLNSSVKCRRSLA